MKHILMTLVLVCASCFTTPALAQLSKKDFGTVSTIKEIDQKLKSHDQMLADIMVRIKSIERSLDSLQKKCADCPKKPTVTEKSTFTPKPKANRRPSITESVSKIKPTAEDLANPEAWKPDGNGWEWDAEKKEWWRASKPQIIPVQSAPKTKPIVQPRTQSSAQSSAPTLAHGTVRNGWTWDANNKEWWRPAVSTSVRPTTTYSTPSYTPTTTYYYYPQNTTSSGVTSSGSTSYYYPSTSSYYTPRRSYNYSYPSVSSYTPSRSSYYTPSRSSQSCPT